MTNSELLRQISRQIADVIKRNPDGWWREFGFYMGMGEFVEFESAEQLRNAVRDGIEIRLKPKRIPIHGWVDADLIDRARNAYGDPDYEPITADLAKALLDCVEKNDE